ncbi:MAG: diguanylate cyclase [Anaerolineae bacterium]|nr:diguanylate cyclase [Anaerolineae bacterium]
MTDTSSTHLTKINFRREEQILRWTTVGVAMLLLLTNADPETSAIGWVAWGLAVLYNAVLSFFSLKRGELPQRIRYSITGIDAVLNTAIILGLRGPINLYLILYALSLASAALELNSQATIRLGILDSVLTGLVAFFWFVEFSLVEQMILAVGVLMGTAIATGLLVQRVRDQLRAEQEHATQLEEKVSELTVLQELGLAVHDLQSGNTLQRIVEASSKILGFRRAALLLTPDGKTADIAEEYFSNRDSTPTDEDGNSELPPLHLDKQLFAALLKADRPFIVDGSQGSPLMAQRPILQIATPLIGETGRIGVLVVDCDDRKTVTPSDLEMLSGLAKSAVLAIQNARLHNKAQRMADLDGLTNIYNHRYFQESLRKTLREAQMKRQPVSLFMFEVDKFKVFNDTYGHRTGDQVLISIARALAMGVREWNGEVARYGGDEFTIILPNVDIEQSIEIANELLSWVTEMVTEDLRKNYDLPGVSFSLGVATYPDDAQSASDLIDAADQAMYVAKRQGGNQVRAFSMTGPVLKPSSRQQYAEEPEQSPTARNLSEQ